MNYEENYKFKTSLFNLMDYYTEELDTRKEKAAVNQNKMEKSSISSERTSFLENIRVLPEELSNNKKCLNENKQNENDIEK